MNIKLLQHIDHKNVEDSWEKTKLLIFYMVSACD